MLYILFSVICSVCVSVLLRFFPRWQIDIRQAIAGNYLTAIALCLLLLQPQPLLLLQENQWPTWFVLLALGLLLPSIFFALARSIMQVGIVRSDAAQRLSLILPLVAAFTLFGEPITASKLLGLLIGICAIAFVVMRHEEQHNKQKNAYFWPLTVFIGFGVIDILFKQMAQISHIPFTTVLFGTFIAAFISISAYLSMQFYRRQAQWHFRNLGAGFLLGLLNFSNIYSYLLAHRALSQEPALVFSSMNIGVIALAAIVGLFLFKERLSAINLIGVALAIAAIIILTLSRF